MVLTGRPPRSERRPSYLQENREEEVFNTTTSTLSLCVFKSHQQDLYNPRCTHACEANNKHLVIYQLSSQLPKVTSLNIFFCPTNTQRLFIYRHKSHRKAENLHI